MPRAQGLEGLSREAVGQHVELPLSAVHLGPSPDRARGYVSVPCRLCLKAVFPFGWFHDKKKQQTGNQKKGSHQNRNHLESVAWRQEFMAGHWLSHKAMMLLGTEVAPWKKHIGSVVVGIAGVSAFAGEAHKIRGPTCQQLGTFASKHKAQKRKDTCEPIVQSHQQIFQDPFRIRHSARAVRTPPRVLHQGAQTHLAARP